MRVVPGLALLILAAAGCAAPRAASPAAAPALPQTLRVGIVEGGRTTIRRLPLDEYVRATVLSEFAPAAGDPAAVERMLEVQSIISRTYAVAHLNRHGRDGFDLCATTHCQLFQPGRLKTSRWAQAADVAVRATSGTVLWFDGGPASALFHADCGGRTSRASDVWGGPAPPYLGGIVDDGPAAGAHTAWSYSATAEAVQRALNADPRTRIGRLSEISIAARDRAGRAERISLRGEETRVVRGEDVRDVLGRAFGARAIRSTRFDLRREGNSFLFEGRGFGHGVGLCQAGAFARVTAGARPAAVLARYDPGARLAGAAKRRD